jgi:hypothetical protein
MLYRSIRESLGERATALLSPYLGAPFDVQATEKVGTSPSSIDCIQLSKDCLALLISSIMWVILLCNSLPDAYLPTWVLQACVTPHSLCCCATYF